MGVKAKTSLSAKPKEGNGRLGQKYGVIGDELNYTLAPPKRTGDRSSEADEDLMATLQKIYDLFEAEPGLTRELKDKVAKTLGKFYHQEEPGFTVDEAYKSIIRDYQIVRDIPDLNGKSRKSGARTSRQSKKTKPREITPPTVNIPSPAAPVGPTLEQIMAGRPFSPGDFMGSTPKVTPQRRVPQRQYPPRVNNNSPIGSPGSSAGQGYRPMMLGNGRFRPPGGRFRPMGPFMGMGMTPPGFYGRP